jgi:hypothetical protein
MRNEYKILVQRGRKETTLYVGTLGIAGSFGVRLSSSLLKNTTFRKLDLIPSSGEEVGDTYSVGSVRKT